MWESLQNIPMKMPHPGERMQLLDQLITTGMDEDNFNAQIGVMHKIFEKLDSLGTPEKPLTTNQIFTISIFISIPSGWIHMITPLMQRTDIVLSRILRDLRSELRLQKTFLEAGVSADVTTKSKKNQTR